MAVENALVERTYQALIEVVQTTAVSRKVLARPPFTFLHKLLVETLGDYDLFSDDQVQFALLISKQAKAAFLTRAIAFVTLVMRSSDQTRISCLLLVSPVQVLAGLNVPDTLEFLLQLCEVCKLSDRDMKETAVKEVLHKGDAQLYASGVTFRKGLVLIQGIIRTFLKRRLRKTSRQLARMKLQETELEMKEGYEEDADAEDKVDEIEMKIILEESQRLSAVREGNRRQSYEGKSERSGDISLADLPDLTATTSKATRTPGFIKRVSSRDSGEALLVTKPSKMRMLQRSQSQRPSTTSLDIVHPGPGNDSMRDTHDNQKDATESQQRRSKNSDWQSSLKKMLAEGRDQSSTPETQRTETSQQDTHDRNLAQVPSFPKLGIPGSKPLGPIVRHGSQGSLLTMESKSGLKDQPQQSQEKTPPLAASRIAPLQRSNSSLSIQRSVTTTIAPSDALADAAFSGTYQTTDQRTQEKLALIRDIVLRIDMYMKRKRLRVIDLFRFCDADGNGSISPEEMLETLSQMEIQLTPEQAREFLDHIDKDGNGSIDIDEFEELVRVSRRNEAQREQVKKELNNPRKQSSNKTSGKANGVIKAKTKQRILDEFNAAQEEEGAGVSATHLRSIITKLALPGVSEALINDLVDRAVGIALGNAGALASMSLSPSHSPSGKTTISFQHLSKALDELEWSKKANRFLNQSWLRQFDSQLERAIREFEML